jgi:ankyrin repeat protein
MLNSELFTAIATGDMAVVGAYFRAFPEHVNVRNLEADDNKPNWDELTPIHVAAKFGHLEIVKLLVELGSTVYSHPSSTYPAVIVAAWKDQQAVVDYFLNEIPEKAEGQRGVGVAINLAGREGWFPQVQMHVEIDPLAVHQRGWIGDSPLHWPAHNGFIEIVDFLLAHGADPNAHEIGWVGGTPLHWASERNPEIIRKLVAAGANVNAQVQKAGSHHLGGTPLHWCARQRDDCGDCISTLLELGADRTILDAEGKTALERATALGNENCRIALTS